MKGLRLSESRQQSSFVTVFYNIAIGEQRFSRFNSLKIFFFGTSFEGDLEAISSWFPIGLCEHREKMENIK